MKYMLLSLVLLAGCQTLYQYKQVNLKDTCLVQNDDGTFDLFESSSSSNVIAHWNSSIEPLILGDTFQTLPLKS